MKADILNRWSISAGLLLTLAALLIPPAVQAAPTLAASPAPAARQVPAPQPSVVTLVPALPPPPNPVATVPMRILGGMFVVPAYIDGHGPFAIGIDSGAATLVITPRVARACGLARRSGTVAVSGTQSAADHGVAQALVGAIKIGGASVVKPFCTVAAEGLPLDGFIGAPLLNAYVTEIDAQAHRVRLYTSASFASVETEDDAVPDTPSNDGPITYIPAGGISSGAGAAPAGPQPDPSDDSSKAVETISSGGPFGAPIPITLGFHRVPVASGKIGGVPARLELDTGSSFPAELTARFVHANNLAHRFDRIGTQQLESSGVAGRAGVYVLDDLSLGDFPAASVKPGDAGLVSGQIGGDQDEAETEGESGAHVQGDIPTLFLAPAGPAASRGRSAQEQYDGRIGAPLLSEFAMTFDYARSRVLLRPLGAVKVPLPHLSR